MAKAMELQVKESLPELKKKQKQSAPHLAIRIQMLILIKEEKQKTKRGLGDALGVSSNTIQTWRKEYKQGGMDTLLADERGGKKAQINPAAHKQIEKRLNNPKEGFKSFKEAQQWINEQFGLTMEYQAVNKYLKRKFGVKLKVARKSHIDKDPAAIAVFKNAAGEAITYKKWVIFKQALHLCQYLFWGWKPFWIVDQAETNAYGQRSKAHRPLSA